LDPRFIPDPDPGSVVDPDPNQSDKLDPKPDPHQFADDKPNCMEYEPILAIFQGFEPLSGS
jgi:hypothetical protein